ncbi:hypothetical protein [Bacillus sp. MMSF_3353]|uniref:hypothetical protein n=1 Tax=Bacillus sp. MMSF_3353 TaxID=3047081 RepID=UPI00273EC9A9|nr:hypothetical protein [Bacillus sp. MMSF_3353]
MEHNSQASFVIKTSNTLNHKTKMGTTPFDWTGSLNQDQIYTHKKATPSESGQLPLGYVEPPNFREWLRIHRVPGYLSYGPYLKPSRIATITVMEFYLEVIGIGNSNDPMFSIDVVDRGNPLIPATTFNVSDLPCDITGFVVALEKGVEIPIRPGMDIESRVMPLGGADIRFHGLHFGIAGWAFDEE